LAPKKPPIKWLNPQKNAVKSLEFPRFQMFCFRPPKRQKEFRSSLQATVWQCSLVASLGAPNALDIESTLGKQVAGDDRILSPLATRSITRDACKPIKELVTIHSLEAMHRAVFIIGNQDGAIGFDRSTRAATREVDRNLLPGARWVC
jgi:hypothetical protein